MRNPPPVESSVDLVDFKGQRVVLSFPWMQWFGMLKLFLQRIADYTTSSIQAPLTGFTITVGDRVLVLTLTPAGTLAAGTIVMPALPVDGQPFEASSTKIITALTVSPGAGQTINNAPTAMAAGIGFAYYYNQAAKTWYRRY